jgi:hypothetical protein
MLGVMKKWLACFFVILVGLCEPMGLYAQIDSARIAQKVRHIPFWNSRDVKKLAATLSKDCETDEETVFAFSYWICKNIRFDYPEYEKRRAENKSIKKILRTHKALSDGYSKLFVELCDAQNIPAIYVPGYIKDYDYMPGDTLYRAEYAWTIVMLSGKWYVMDLTAASCKIIAAVNPLSRVSWALLRIPYASHLKAVMSYDPQYLYIDPTKNLSRLIPVSDMFQLVQNPMPMSSFMMSDSLVHAYLAANREKDEQNEQLLHFNGLPQAQKNILLIEECKKQNPINYYTQGLYYYYNLKEFYNSYYIAEKGKIFAPLEESEKALEYAKTANSLFLKATENNNKEFSKKEAKSEYWRSNLIESNKVLSSSLSLQIKVNQQQVRSVATVTGEEKNIQSYIAKYQNKYALRDIVDLPRPMIQNNESKKEGEALLAESKAAIARSQSYLQEYNSLLLGLGKSTMDSSYEQQQKASKLCNEELSSLSRYLDRKENNLSLVYYSDKYVFKRGYFKAFEKVGNINESFTDPLVDLMVEREPQVFQLIQNYVTEISTALNLLKSAKSKLSIDYGEDDLYEKTALAFNAQLQKISTQMSDIAQFNEKLTSCLDNDVSIYQDIVKMLQNDNSMENRRHKEYMDYRKSIKQAENDKIRYYQEVIKGYQKLISKAVNGK